MSFFPLLQGIAGVRRAIFRNSEGELLEGMGTVTRDTKHIASTCTTISQRLTKLGHALRFGPSELLVVRTPKLATILVFREGDLAVLDVDPKRVSPEFERTLRTKKWSASEVDIARPPAPLTPAPLTPAPVAQPRPYGGIVAKSPNAKTANIDQRGPRCPTREIPLIDPRALANTGDAGLAAEEVAIVTVDKSVLAASAEQRMQPLRTTSTMAVITDPMMFAGSLRMVSLPDLLEFCRTGRRTGLLLCRFGDSEGSVRLYQGRIIDSEAPVASRKSLLDLLQERKVVSERQINDLDLSNKKAVDRETIIKLLVDGGMASPETIQAAVLQQIQDAIEEMLDWVDGSFAFHPAEEDPHASGETGVDSQFILLQIFKAKDEKDHDTQAG